MSDGTGHPPPMTFGEAARRPNGSGRTVWLASYPKSGNTWMRAIVTALSSHPHLFGVNHLGSGAQPYAVNTALTRFGLDPRWLALDELDLVRHELVTRDGTNEPLDGPPVLRKTHEIFRVGAPGAEPFPPLATRAAILVVRDPRDVASSYGPFFGLATTEAIDKMTSHRVQGTSSALRGMTAQPWGSWSSHTRSWLSPDVPFPVHVVRYEDLLTDAVSVLEPVFAAIGLSCDREQLADAVERSSFERLRQSEQQRGFRETSPRTEVFFRKGRSGSWADELAAEQVLTIEAHCGEVMALLGYPMVTKAPRIGELAAHLGLAVRLGEVPTALEGGRRIHRQVWVDETRALVRFGPRRRLLVEGGKVLTLEWPWFEGDESAPDVSWVLQGWGVVLAVLQRGELALHASTVRIAGQAVALAGDRGAGKSTTSLALSRRGHSLLVDDTTLVKIGPDGAVVTPYCRNLHILPDTAEMFGIDFASLVMLAGDRQKAVLRPEEPPVEPTALARVIVLEIDDTLASPVCEALEGLTKLEALRTHFSRSGLSRALLGAGREFDLLTQLAGATKVHRIRRPTRPVSVDAVCDLIEGVIAQNEG